MLGVSLTASYFSAKLRLSVKKERRSSLCFYTRKSTVQQRERVMGVRAHIEVCSWVAAKRSRKDEVDLVLDTKIYFFSLALHGRQKPPPTYGMGSRTCKE